MIITRNYAKKLVRAGKAEEVGIAIIGTANRVIYMTLNRLDIQRTDHYPAERRDALRLMKAGEQMTIAGSK